MSEQIKELENIIEDISTKYAENFYDTICLLETILLTQERGYERSHCRYVSSVSASVAEHLEMNETDVFKIKTAGLLHDIGKIGFRETILNKTSKEMTDSEYKQYMLHPAIGREMLMKHRGFSDIGEIVFQHHEKIDGSGFPNHLQGKEISPGAAIIAAVDTFHSLFYKLPKGTSARSSSLQYTNAVNYLTSTQNRYNASIAYLQQKAGKLFDKKVIAILIDIVELERKNIGMKTVVRLPVHNIEPGMIFAEDYISSFGLVIAYRGEEIRPEMKKTLLRFAENGEIPHKILVMK